MVFMWYCSVMCLFVAPCMLIYSCCVCSSCVHSAGSMAQDDEEEDSPMVEDDLGASREGSRTDAEVVDR